MTDHHVETPAHRLWSKRAAALLGLEALGLLGLAAFYAVHLVRRDAQFPAGATATLIVTVVAAAALFFLARGVRRLRDWSRTPGLLVQAFLLVVAVPLAFSERWPVGAPLVALAGITAVALLRAESGSAVDRRP